MKFIFRIPVDIHSAIVLGICMALTRQQALAWTNNDPIHWHICGQTSNIIRTLEGNQIVDHSDVVGASPVGAAPTTSSFSTWHLASVDWADRDNCKTKRETLKCRVLKCTILEVWQYASPGDTVRAFQFHYLIYNFKGATHARWTFIYSTKIKSIESGPYNSLIMQHYHGML